MVGLSCSHRIGPLENPFIIITAIYNTMLSFLAVDSPFSNLVFFFSSAVGFTSAIHVRKVTEQCSYLLPMGTHMEARPVLLEFHGCLR